MKALLGCCALLLGLAVPAHAEPGFEIRHVVVDGNTLLAASDLQRAVAPYEGHRITLDDLNRLAEQINDLYRQRGWFLTRVYVPPQAMQGGEARLRVLEGRIGQIHVQGNKFYSTAFIRSRFAPLLQGGPPRYEALEKAIRLLNENPDLDAHLALRAGTEPGTTDVDVIVHDSRPSHFVTEYDNYGSPFIGQNRLQEGFTTGDLTGRGDALRVEGMYAFPALHAVPSAYLIYSLPITPGGARLAITGARGDFLIGDQFQSLNLQTTSQIAGLVYSNPLQRDIRTTSNLSAAFYTKSFNSTALGQNTGHDEIRELTLGTDGTRVGTGGYSAWSLSLTQGLGGALGGSSNGNGTSRPFAGDSFNKLNGSFSRTMKMGATTFLVLRGTVQLTASPLVLGEQFPLGGPDSVRGFQLAQVLTDSGYAASGEVYFRLSHDNHVQGVVFIDTGTGWLQRPVAGELASESLTGTGVGVRATLNHATTVRLDLGFPVAAPSTITNRGAVLYAAFSTRY